MTHSLSEDGKSSWCWLPATGYPVPILAGTRPGPSFSAPDKHSGALPFLA